TVPSPLPVTFQFQLAIPRPFAAPIPALTPIPALLTISAVDNGTMVGTQQPVKNLVFTIAAQNTADFYDFGAAAPSQNILLQTTTSPLGDITGVVSNAFLDTDFLRGLIMDSDYLFIDPTQNQTATWSFSNVNPAPLAADPVNGILRSTLFGGNGNFSAHVSNIIPEPGAMALLIGFGVTGGLLALRRRAR
ncbi:MAG: hypothetical protein NZ557_00255, partial [Chthonomonadaceae bacterium]|nr:hypothetical protein [Chthonomonadaceae bacterium]